MFNQILPKKNLNHSGNEDKICVDDSEDLDMTNHEHQEPEEEKQERTFLTFSDFDTFRKNFPQTKPKEPQQVTAAFTVPHDILVQWGSEYQTSLVFKWSKRGWMPNGLVFECHLNTGQPNHLNTAQMDAILFSYVLVWYSNDWSSTGVLNLGYLSPRGYTKRSSEMQIIALGYVNYDIGGTQIKKIIAWGYVKSSEGTQGVL